MISQASPKSTSRAHGCSSQHAANCCLAIRRRCADSRLRAQVAWLQLCSVPTAMWHFRKMQRGSHRGVRSFTSLAMYHSEQSFHFQAFTFAAQNCTVARRGPRGAEECCHIPQPALQSPHCPSAFSSLVTDAFFGVT